MLKNERGVTMIALVVTIVIFLILSAVTISFTVGDNSIMDKAVEGTNESKVSGVQELFQFYVSDEYADEKDVFVDLIAKGYVKQLDNADGESIFYITKNGIENIAPNFADTTSDDYIYQLLPQLRTEDSITISDVELEALKNTDVYLVDRQLNVAFLSGNQIYGNVIFAESDIMTTDKWWVDDSILTKDEIIKIVTVDKIKYEASNITGEAKVIGYQDQNVNSTLVIPRSIKVQFSDEETMDVKVAEIADEAFASSRNINFSSVNVILPSTLKRIGDAAFSGQSNLATISLSESLVEIGESAFKGCSNLHGTFTFPATLQKIGSEAFYQCVNGSKVFDFSACTKLKEIPERAFYGCNSIGTLMFPEGLTQIKERAFANCSNCQITNLEFPSSLTEIAVYAFDGFYNINGQIILKNPDTVYSTNSFRSDYISKIIKKSN